MISCFGLQEVCLSTEKKTKQRYGTLFKMDFLLLAPLRYGNIARILTRNLVRILALFLVYPIKTLHN